MLGMPLTTLLLAARTPLRMELMVPEDRLRLALPRCLVAELISGAQVEPSPCMVGTGLEKRATEANKTIERESLRQIVGGDWGWKNLGSAFTHSATATNNNTEKRNQTKRTTREKSSALQVSLS